MGAVPARDGRDLSGGYNGSPRGLPHSVHVDDEPCTDSLHAEETALLNAAYHGVSSRGTALYCTHSPCKACTGRIINVAVVAVVYALPYRSDAGLARLAVAGVLVEKLQEAGCLPTEA
ncbi:cytidine/deoxycytidylate deaminase family protein [Pseudonocardia xinjiangensis]